MARGNALFTVRFVSSIVKSEGRGIG